MWALVALFEIEGRVILDNSKQNRGPARARWMCQRSSEVTSGADMPLRRQKDRV
jgi:hypothetical protein